MVAVMSRTARQWMMVCAILGAMALSSTALASAPRTHSASATATAASAYSAKVKGILDHWAKAYPGVGEKTPVRLRRQMLSGSAITRDAAIGLDHLSPPARWRATQHRTSDALRRFATTLHAMADQLKGKKTSADVAKMRSHTNAKFFRDAGAAAAAMTALRKAT
jgi:hypothetical protein